MPDHEQQQDKRLARYTAMDRAGGNVTDSELHKALFRQPRERDDASRTQHMIKASQDLKAVKELED